MRTFARAEIAPAFREFAGTPTSKQPVA